MCFDEFLLQFIYSKATTTGSFVKSGLSHGVTRVSLVDSDFSDFMPIHNNIIKDTVVSPYRDNLLLSASLDSTLKLSSLSSLNICQRFIFTLD